MIVAYIVGLMLIIALVIDAYYLWRLGILRSRLRQGFVVTLKTGAAFQGVLYAADRHVWVLRNAVALAAGENGVNVIVDGEVLILSGDIAYAQKP